MFDVKLGMTTIIYLRPSNLITPCLQVRLASMGAKKFIILKIVKQYLPIITVSKPIDLS